MLYEPRYWGAGVGEIIEGVVNWRLWHLIGAGEMRRRYARSSIGQFWVSLSMGLSALVLGAVWSILWKVELREFLPHVTVSIVIWQLMSGMLTDASGTFSGNKHLLLSQRLACSTLIVSMIYKNVLAFIHNCLVVVIVFAIFGQTPNWQVILLPIALALLVVCAVWVCYVTALGCTRFRDFNYAMQTVLQLAFYVTPVIWKPEFLGEQYQWVLYCNPFAIFMTIIRSCFVGGPFPVIEWLLAVAITFGGFLIALPVIGKYRRQLLFWV